MGAGRGGEGRSGIQCVCVCVCDAWFCEREVSFFLVEVDERSVLGRDVFSYDCVLKLFLRIFV